MDIVRHRVNTLSDLRTLPPHWGAEIDVRSAAGALVLQHEPFQPGAPWLAFLDEWAARPGRGLLILNPKEDGLETRLVADLAARGIERYVFLDLTLPTAVRLAVRQGFRRIAVRVSEYEPIEGALRFAGLVDWAWLDSFAPEPPSPALAEALRQHFRVCLVSPELQGHAPDALERFLPLAAHVDAVCTKVPERWLTPA